MKNVFKSTKNWVADKANNVKSSWAKSSAPKKVIVTGAVILTVAATVFVAMDRIKVANVLSDVDQLGDLDAELSAVGALAGEL